MKTKEELVKLLFLPEFGRHVNVDSLVDKVLSIQQDAFESGRISGRVEEMNRVARLVEDELPMTAESFRKWANELSTQTKVTVTPTGSGYNFGAKITVEPIPPATKSDVEVQNQW